MLEDAFTENTILLREADPSRSAGRLKRGLAFTAATCSLFAVVAVPYLVLKSVYFLMESKNNDSFAQMMGATNFGFWILGSIVSFLAFIAIAPFNFYNIYKTVDDAHELPCASMKSILINFLRILFIASGSVNGFNTNMAYCDVIGCSSAASQIFQILLVFNAVLFAGLADSRIVINYVSSEFPRDFRYIARVSNSLFRRIPFFNYQGYRSLSREQLIKRITKKLDDFYYVVMLGLNDTYLNEQQSLVQNKTWLRQPDSAEFQNYIDLCNNQFPFKKYILSEVLGGALSILLAYFGNKNVLEFAKKSIIGFFLYCGAPDSAAVVLFASGFSWIGYVVGVLVSFFLIRDLFFRDVFKKNDIKNLGCNVLVKFATLIPALSFGLLNVILTVMNKSLSPVEKFIVAFSAIIGATVVSRYGIEGGLREFAGKLNVRREFAAVPAILTKMLYEFSDTQLKEIADRLGCFPENNIPLSGLSEDNEFYETRNDSRGLSYQNQLC